jgi:hypothetical protein
VKRLQAWLGPDRRQGEWLRGLAVAVAVATFMTIAGAFGTIDAPLAVRAGYWFLLMVVGYLWGATVSRLFFTDGRLSTGRVWLDILLATLIMSTPFTLVVWVASSVFFGARVRLETLPVFYGSVFVVSLAVTSIYLLIESRRVTETTAGPSPPRFLERLPLRLRGGELWAVEAEDHYLRLHTSKGQDLILLRLADAVAELEGLEGVQVHRSWWVARDAIVDARRSDGRATLTLKDGAQVPVSRTYAGLLREKGWI